MDYDYWLRLSKVGQMHFIDRYLASFRLHADSKSMLKTREQLSEALWLATHHGAGPLGSLHALHDVLVRFVYRVCYRGLPPQGDGGSLSGDAA